MFEIQSGSTDRLLTLQRRGTMSDTDTDTPSWTMANPPDWTTVWSQDFIAALPSQGRPPGGCTKSYEMRVLNAELWVYTTKDSEVCVVVDGNGILTVSSVERL